MFLSDLPQRFPIPFGDGAGPGYIRAIPTASQIGVNDGAASLTDGFVPLNATPVASGGIPPSIEDMNGILYRLSGWARWVAAGGPARYDSGFATAIGGYPSGAVVQSAADPTLFWVSTVNANTGNPDASAANWTPLINARATGAQVLARTDDSKVITPKALADAWTFGSNGQGNWERLPSGRYEMWGTTPAISENMGAITYSFPVAFPNGCQNLVATTRNNTANRTEPFDLWAQVVGYTATTFTIMQQARDTTSAGTPLNIEWRATGR